MTASSIHDMVHRYTIGGPRQAADPADVKGPYDTLIETGEVWLRRVAFGLVIVSVMLGKAHVSIAPTVFGVAGFVFATWVATVILVAIGKKANVVGAKLLDDMPKVGDTPNPTGVGVRTTTTVAESPTTDDVEIEKLYRDERADRHRLTVKNVGSVTYWFDYDQHAAARNAEQAQPKREPKS